MEFLRKNVPPAIKEHFKGSKPTQDYFMLVNNFFDGANRRHTAEAITIQNWPSIKQVWNLRSFNSSFNSYMINSTYDVLLAGSSWYDRVL